MTSIRESGDPQSFYGTLETLCVRVLELGCLSQWLEVKKKSCFGFKQRGSSSVLPLKVDANRVPEELIVMCETDSTYLFSATGYILAGCIPA